MDEEAYQENTSEVTKSGTLNEGSPKSPGQDTNVTDSTTTSTTVTGSTATNIGSSLPRVEEQETAQEEGEGHEAKPEVNVADQPIPVLQIDAPTTPPFKGNI